MSIRNFFKNIKNLTDPKLLNDTLSLSLSLYIYIYIRGVTVHVFVPNRFGTGLLVRHVYRTNSFLFFFSGNSNNKCVNMCYVIYTLPSKSLESPLGKCGFG